MLCVQYIISSQTSFVIISQVSTLAGETLPCVLVAAKDELVMSADLEKEVAAAAADLQVTFIVSLCYGSHLWVFAAFCSGFSCFFRFSFHVFWFWG